jgi:hypothetical protein
MFTFKVFLIYAGSITFLVVHDFVQTCTSSFQDIVRCWIARVTKQGNPSNVLWVSFACSSQRTASTSLLFPKSTCSPKLAAAFDTKIFLLHSDPSSCFSLFFFHGYSGSRRLSVNHGFSLSQISATSGLGQLSLSLPFERGWRAVGVMCILSPTVDSGCQGTLFTNVN